MPHQKNLMRMETDPLGKIEVLAASLHGAQTERARANFPLTGTPIAALPQLIVALAQVKKAAALTNFRINALDADVVEAIVKVCDEIIGGAHHDHFCVYVCQGGAGTSTNMNANEVIANRATQLLGKQYGRARKVHPTMTSIETNRPTMPMRRPSGSRSIR